MSTEYDPEKIFVVDADNRPLAVMSPAQVHHQGLRHRGFLLLLKDRRGRLMLRRLDRTHPLHPGLWDVTGSGHVGADEAADEAAERLLPPSVLAAGETLRHTLTLNAEAGTGNEIVEVFEAIAPDAAAQSLARELLFLPVDTDELEALATTFPEQLTPDLMAVWAHGLHRPQAS